MNSLFYLLRKSAKNTFKELLRKPARLVMYILVLVVIAGMILLSVFTRETTDTRLPLFWLEGAVLALGALLTVTTVMQGTSTGSSFFEMNDVNILFVSPLSPRKILLYGIIKLMKTSLFAGFFILFQTQTIGSNFGVGFGGVMVVFAAFALCVSVLTVGSLLIYNVSNGRPERKRMVKILALVMFTPLLAMLFKGLVGGDGPVAALEYALGSSPALYFVPVAGWVAKGVGLLLSGRLLEGLLMFGLTAATGAAMTLRLIFGRVDYYEDVLCATETAFQKKRALQEGNIRAVTATPKRVKVRATGIGGAGASALCRKHLREAFRERRLGFFGIQSLFLLGIALLSAAFMPGEVGFLPIPLFLMWFQVFMIGTGHGIKELYSHYIFMIPEPSFRKLLWNNAEMMVKTALEGAVYFIASGALMGASVPVIACAWLAYVLFTLYLLGINFVSIRWTGGKANAGLLVFLYMMAVMILMVPGAIPAGIVGVLIGGNAGIAVGLLILSGWELLLAAVAFLTAQGILHNCDMPSGQKMDR